MAVTMPLYINVSCFQVGLTEGVRKTVMLEYRVYVIDSKGKIIERIDLECPNDDKAVSDGSMYAQRNGVEIWCGQRLVKTIHALV